MKKITIIIITIGVVVVGVLFLNYDPDNPKKPPTENTGNIDNNSKVSNDVIQITNVVGAFLNNTLGSLSDGNLNLEMALELTVPPLFDRLNGFSSIPRIYGIQDGPDSVDIGKPQLTTDKTAIVSVEGLWGGEVMQAWDFELVIDNGTWRIKRIIPAN